MPETVDSGSDARTVNNVVRHEYRVLTDDEKAAMKRIKDRGADFIGDVNFIRDNYAKQSGREFALAVTKLEEAVMWAVKGLTK